MKQLKNKLWAKITALFLLAVFAFMTYASGVGIVYLTAEDVYLDDGKYFIHRTNEDMVYSIMDDILVNFEEGIQESMHGNTEYAEYLESMYARENTNVLYTIKTLGGDILATNDTGEETRLVVKEIIPVTIYGDLITDAFTFSSPEAADAYLTEQIENGKYVENSHIKVEDDTASATGVRATLTVTWTDVEIFDVELTCALAEDLLAMDDFRRVDYWLSVLLSLQPFLVPICIFSFAVCFALFVFLLVAAGHKEGVEGIHLSWFSRIPLDLLAAALVGTGILIVALTIELCWRIDWIFVLVAIGIDGMICLMLLMALLMSFSARAKAGKWWRNTVIWYACRLLHRMVRSVWRAAAKAAHCIGELLHALPGCWQLVAIVVGVSTLELLLALFSRNESTMLILCWMLERVVFIILALLLHLSFRRIEEGGKALAEGDLHHQVPISMTVPPFRKHAEHLNSIGIGMKRAVDQQTRSERTKTELITNVSHDIKTPLTSIVNYVDLLKGLNIENDSAREYLDVLDRQSQRLRKLTEDLVEASKASAGNIPMNLEPTDPNLLLAQAVGEYEDRFKELNLELVQRPSPVSAAILADGKLLWRVFDNLLSNICKYSLQGTRVYLSTEVQNGRVTVSFKNISRYALDITSDELMERFVRGDSSRSTEGSGLGLSIARSLTAMQGGEFHLSIDGDLFRADISFPTI